MKVVFLLGSKVDIDHAENIAALLQVEWGIDSEIFVGSAHKVPVKVANLIERVNKESDIVYVTIAGRSNALSGVVAGNSVHPVIACPPFSDKDDMMININSTLQMPSEVPVMTVLDPKNVAHAIAKIFALKDKGMLEKVVARMKDVRDSFNI